MELGTPELVTIVDLIWTSFYNFEFEFVLWPDDSSTPISYFYQMGESAGGGEQFYASPHPHIGLVATLSQAACSISPLDQSCEIP